MANYQNDMWAGLDPARREAFQRAVTSSNAGAKLVQNLTNRIIQQLSLRSYGILGVMDVRPGQGQSALVNRRTAGSNNNWLADTDTPTDGAGTYDRATFTYKTIVGRAQVTRKIQATGRAYVDVLAEEMMQKLEDFNDSLDAGLLLGEPTALDPLATDTDSVRGFMTACNTYGASATSTGTQVVDNNDGAVIPAILVLAQLDEAIDKVKGSANRSDLVIVSSYGGLRAINKALTGRQVFNDTVEVAAGFRVRTYDGIPIIPDTNMPDTFAKTITGGSGGATTYLTGSTGGTGTNILIMNKRLNWIEELTPTTVMPLARDNSQNENFDIFWDGAAVLANPLASSLIISVKPG